MSQKTVQLIIGRLVTDEDYRGRFLDDSRAFLLALREQGLELTEREIDALVRTDAALWPEAAGRVHPDLQRSSLRSN